MSDLTISATRKRYLHALFLEGALDGLAGGCLGASAALLAVRILLHPAPMCWSLAAFGLIPAGIALGALINLRRMPSRATLAALTEDASHAGGLVLVRGISGSDRWPTPALAAPSVPLRLRRRIPRLAAAVLMLVGAMLVPSGWFEASAAPKPSFPDVTAPLREELAEIREDESLPPDEIAAIEEEIARIEAAADPTKPAETLEAVDRLAERVSSLLELSGVTARRLTDDRRELAATPDAAALAEQFKEMLESAPSSEDTMKDYCVCDEGCCRCGQGCDEGEGEGEGEGENPGSGGVTRGRGDAPMDWGRQSELGDSSFRDQSRETASVGDKTTEKTGESIADDDPTARAVRTGPAGASAVKGHSTGVTVTRPVLPRHRATVRRFFEPERKQQ